MNHVEQFGILPRLLHDVFGELLAQHENHATVNMAAAFCDMRLMDLKVEDYVKR